MGSPFQPQAQQALGPLQVFVTTPIPTRLFLRCYARESIRELQGSLPVCRMILVALLTGPLNKAVLVLPKF